MIFPQILYFFRGREKVTSNSIIPYSFITQKTFIKSNFPSSWFGYPEVQLIEERQDKCLVLLLYLLVFKVKHWFPSIPQRGTNLLEHHFTLMDLNLFDVFKPTAVILIDAKCPNSASGGLFEMVPEFFWPDLDDFLAFNYDKMFQSHFAHFFGTHFFWYWNWVIIWPLNLAIFSRNPGSFSVLTDWLLSEVNFLHG